MSDGGLDGGLDGGWDGDFDEGCASSASEDGRERDFWTLWANSRSDGGLEWALEDGREKGFLDALQTSASDCCPEKLLWALWLSSKPDRGLERGCDRAKLVDPEISLCEGGRDMLFWMSSESDGVRDGG